MKSPSNDAESLKPLTSLRFVAAAMVVCFHASIAFHWPWLKHIPTAFATSVSFFFVLSGFILSYVYTSRDFPGYVPFLRARFARLWPLQVLAVILLIAVAPLDLITSNGPGIFNKWATLAANLSLTQALVPYPAYFYSWNFASWSISTEMGFYLAFPFLLMNIRRTWHRKLLGSVAIAYALVAIMKMLGLPYDGEYHTISMHAVCIANPLFRGVEFCMGMATWALWDRYVKHWTLSFAAWTLLEVTALAIVVIWLTLCFDPLEDMIPPGSGRLLFDFHSSCLLYAFLIVVLASGRGLVGRLLSRRLFVFLGEISFSVYMLHLVLMATFVYHFQGAMSSPLPYFTVLLLLATASYLLVEKPAQRFLIGKRKRAMRVIEEHTPGMGSTPG
jgi:peptidoglycan/LPS O-acetylase OafA/YrhL